MDILPLCVMKDVRRQSGNSMINMPMNHGAIIIENIVHKIQIIYISHNSEFVTMIIVVN